jgi:hypothetical protein
MIIVENIIKPRPPHCRSIRITSCPKNVKYVEVSTTISPVTVIADADVNNAFSGSIEPVCDEKGNINKRAPITIIDK